MNTDNQTRSPKMDLIRESAVLQLKLLADGLRDAVLIPVSIVATIVGLLRGGDEPEREYRRVLKLGRRSERWINLFGHQRPLGNSHRVGSLDHVLDQVEAVVKDQYHKGRTTAEAKTAIKKALDKVQDE